MNTPDIHFFTEDISFRLNSKKKLRSWLDAAIREEGRETGGLCYIFCSDSYLLEINNTYLRHNTYTDIVTFDHSDNPSVVAGDIFISVERVRENASAFRTSRQDELLRVMIHGVLHLCGYKDKKKPDRSIMREKEDHYIRIYKTFLHE